MFARLVVERKTPEVDYLSVQLDGDPSTLFQQFKAEYNTAEFKSEFDILQSWLVRIGRRRRGAQLHHFRNEKRAAALPPLSEKRTMLRLYAMRLTRHAVVLFGGGLKTARRAQDCPTVRPHFELANRLAVGIDRELIDNRFDLLNSDDEFVDPFGGYPFEY